VDEMNNDAASPESSSEGWWSKFKSEPITQFTAVLAVATIVLVITGFIQAFILKNQVAEMKDDKRPWVYTEGALPWTGLVIDDEKAEIILQFALMNTGKSPARFVNIEDEFFFITAGITTDKEVYDKFAVCNALKYKSVPGTAIFPGQKTPLNHIFTMNKETVAEWKKPPQSSNRALMISGCIDYIFGTETTHHQTRFIYELDKQGPNRGFLQILPVNGEIPINELALAVNPTLIKDAD
jgi:hypothetical protein